MHLAVFRRFRLIYPPQTGIRLVGVTVSNFETQVREDVLALFGSKAATADAVRPAHVE